MYVGSVRNKIALDGEKIFYYEGNKHEKKVGVILNKELSRCVVGFCTLTESSGRDTQTEAF